MRRSTLTLVALGLVLGLSGCTTSPTEEAQPGHGGAGSGGGANQSNGGGYDGGSGGQGDSNGGSGGNRGSDLAFGTLMSLPQHTDVEVDAGIAQAMVEVEWDTFEPDDDAFDEGYLAAIRSDLEQLRDSGRSITLAIGYHYTPDWVAEMPGARMVNQLGESSEEADFVFNATVRAEAEEFLSRLFAGIDISHVDVVRVTSGAMAEVVYPGDGNYWAFSDGAQNGGAKPSSLAPNPFPGWHPGDDGLDDGQVRVWADWYVGALADVVLWQVDALGALGFDGHYEILTPGSGVRPGAYAELIAERLPPGLLGVGAAWERLYAQLPPRPKMVAYVSSVADLSGGDDACEPGDDQVPVDASEADGWSSTRWIARLASEYGFQRGGENPGWNGAPGLDNEYQLALAQAYQDTSDQGMMARAIAQASSCGFGALYWAHDHNLWDGTVPFSSLAERIAALE